MTSVPRHRLCEVSLAGSIEITRLHAVRQRKTKVVAAKEDKRRVRIPQVRRVWERKLGNLKDGPRRSPPLRPPPASQRLWSLNFTSLLRTVPTSQTDSNENKDVRLNLQTEVRSLRLNRAFLE